MTLQEVAELKLMFNGKDVKNGLDEIAEQIDVLKGKQSQFTRADKEWQELNKEIKSLSASYKTVEERMDIQLMKTDQLRKYPKELRTELGRKVGTDHYEPLKERLTEVNTRMAQLKADQYQVTKEGQTLWQKWGSTIKGALAFGGALEVFNMLKGFGQGVIEEAQKFETASQSLRGEVTLTEEQFGKLKESSKETGEQFGMTGAEMMDAYNMIASGKSELVDVEGGIEAVTDAAITLATNGEMQLKPAAEGLTEVLNQFGAEADEAAKYVDIMSTGTQVGAGKIESITQALSYAGPMAKAAGLSFSETNAALQIFEQNGIKGQRAGTGLRGVLAELMKGADDTNPALVGLQTAVENLSKKNLTAAEYTQLFGRENVSAGIALVSSSEKLQDWTEQIEEGGGAAAMFAEKTKSSTFEQKRAQAEYANVRQELGEKLLPAYTAIYKGTLSLISGTIRLAMGLGEIPKFVKENKELFIALAVAVVSLNTANIAAAASAIAHAAAEKGRAIATKATTAAQLLLNAAMMANPIGLVVAAIAALTGGLIWAYKNVDWFRAGINATWAGLKTFISIIWDTYKALWSFDFSKVWDNLKNGWKKVTDSTAKAYTETMAEANKKVAENNEAHREKELSAEDKKIQELKAQNDKLQKEIEEANKEHNDQKGRDNDDFRKKENKKREEQRNKQIADEKELTKKLDELWLNSIEDQIEKNKIKLLQKYDDEVLAIDKLLVAEERKNEAIELLTKELLKNLNDLESKKLTEDVKEIEKLQVTQIESTKKTGRNIVEEWKQVQEKILQIKKNGNKDLNDEDEIQAYTFKDLWKDTLQKLKENFKDVGYWVSSSIRAAYDLLAKSQDRIKAKLKETTNEVERVMLEHQMKLNQAASSAVTAVDNLLAGNFLGAIANGVRALGTAMDSWISKQNDLFLAKLEERKKELEAAGQLFIDNSERFLDVANLERIEGVYGSLMDKAMDLSEIRLDLGEFDTAERRIQQEITIGEHIIKNYQTAVNKENDYSSLVMSNIQKAYDEEVRRINEKYAFLISQSNQAYNADTLRVKEQLSEQLLALITNEDSKTSVVEEYSAKRSQIMQTFALADMQITDGMDQSQIDAINAAIDARAKALDQLQNWYNTELDYIVNAEGQKRKEYTETETLKRESDDRLAELALENQANQIELNRQKNAELEAAEKTKNANLEAEEKRHNDMLVKLGQDKDAALAESFNILKGIVTAGYDEIMAKALEAYNQGMITAGQYNELINQLNTLRGLASQPITTPNINWNIDLTNLPNYGSFGAGGAFPAKDPSYFENVGVLGGLRHSTPEGGNWVINPRTGRLLAKVEAGEFIRVYSRDMTARMSGKLAKVNASNIVNTGVPVFAAGGYMGMDGVSLGYARGDKASTPLSLTSKVLEDKLDTVVVELMNVQGYLSQIAESSDKTAKKPPLTVREISKGLNDSANLDRRSGFS